MSSKDIGRQCDYVSRDIAAIEWMGSSLLYNIVLVLAFCCA